MYTLCYTNAKGEDRWARCDTLEEAAAIIIKEGVEDSLEDFLLFSPDADDRIVDMDEFAAKFMP